MGSPPIGGILGPSTGLAGPQALVFDDAGELLVTNEYAGTVTVYGAGAQGNATPVRKITGLNKATDVTLKRGVIGSLNLYQWLNDIRNGNQNAERTVTIHLQNE